MPLLQGVAENEGDEVAVGDAVLVGEALCIPELLGDADAEADTDQDTVAEADCEGPALALPLPDAVEVEVGDTDPEAEPEVAAVCVIVPVLVAVALGEAEAEGAMLGDGVGEVEDVPVADCVAEGPKIRAFDGESGRDGGGHDVFMENAGVGRAGPPRVGINRGGGEAAREGHRRLRRPHGALRV